MSMLVRTVPRRIFGLVILIFLVSSVAICTTGLLLFSSAESLQAAAGARGNSVLVYSSTARVPETSSIPLSVEKIVSRISGVVSTIPEVTTPVSADGKVVFLRGANLTAFAAAEGLSLESGSWPTAADNSSLVLGLDVARALDISLGQKVAIFSFFQNKTYSLTVAGVLASGPPYEDEVLSSLAFAQAMRGFDPGTVTMLSVQVNPSGFDAAALNEAVASLKASPSSSPIDLALLPLSSFSGVNPSSVIDQVLGRSLGLSASVFWALVAVVAAACLAIVFFGLSWSVSEYSGVLSVLTDIGMTRRRVAVNLGVSFAAVGAAAGVVGYFLGYASLVELSGVLSERVFFHTLVIRASPDLLLFSAVFPIAAVALALPAAVRSLKLHG